MASQHCSGHLTRFHDTITQINLGESANVKNQECSCHYEDFHANTRNFLILITMSPYDKTYNLVPSNDLSISHKQLQEYKHYNKHNTIHK